MEEITIYVFPTIESGVREIQDKYFELVKKYHNHEHIAFEEKDWMDWANTVLDAVVF